MLTKTLPTPSDNGDEMRTWCVEVVQAPTMGEHLPKLPGALAVANTPLTATAAMRIPSNWPRERVVDEVLRILPPYFEPGNINAWDQPWEWDQCAPTVETIARASLRSCQCGRWPHHSCECIYQGPSYPRPCCCRSNARIDGVWRPYSRRPRDTRFDVRRCPIHDETTVYLAKDVRWEGPFS